MHKTVISRWRCIYLTSSNPNIKTIQINNLADITISGVIVITTFKQPEIILNTLSLSTRAKSFCLYFFIRPVPFFVDDDILQLHWVIC